MFKAVPMMQLQAIVLTGDERGVLEELGRLGAVHLTRMPSGPDTVLFSPVDHAEYLARCDRIRARIGELRQSLEVPYLPKEPKIPSLTWDEAEESISSMEKQGRDLLMRRQRLVQRLKETKAICEQVSSYQGFEIPLAGYDQFSFLHFVTGSLPSQNLDVLAKKVDEKVVLFPLTQQKGRQTLLAVTTRQGQQALEETLEKAGFQPETLPVVEGTTADRLYDEKEKEQEQLAGELEELNGHLRKTAEEFSLPLAEIECFADREYRLLDASQKFPRTEATVLISGWVPASTLTALRQCISEATKGRYILEAIPPKTSPEEDVPVLLRHSSLLRPFEVLVSTYGLPSYREVEPTFFVAVSYIVMFGLMFGDAGHGLILAICGLIAIFAGRSRKIRDIGTLLLFGGLSSIIFGIVYGSYFGIEAFKHYAIWHDPIEGDPIQLMYGTIGIGVAMISLGMILNIINRFRRGDVVGGVLDKFGLVGLLFYWGTLFLLIKGDLIRSQGLMGLSLILFLAVPVVGWSLKEPLEHYLNRKKGGHGEADEGMAGALIESCVGAFEAILSYLANTISFVRLAAYAMSHAALLFAAFMLAAEVRSTPFGGSVWSLLVIIAGNIIAIVLEGVIASVQALRLEYYEFFGKFFSGSGRPFEPFHLNTHRKDSSL